MPPNDGDAEIRTVLLAAGGDAPAFDELVRHYGNYIETLLRRTCGHAALAEDLTQLTFLKAWQRLHALRDATAFRPWLRRIALNVAVDAARSGAFSSAAMEADETSLSGNEPAEEAIVRRLDVDAALARLSFAQRTCIVLAYGERMSHSEIAAVCDLPIGTVKSHIARGLAALRTLMGNTEGAYGRS